MSVVRTRAAIAVATVAVAATMITPSPALASPSAVPANTAKVDCVQFDPVTGACQIAGVVYAITQVGQTTYIGGSFTSVSGTPRANVAAIQADGSLDPLWNPSTNGVVYALAASSDGSKIFLGGGFTTVGATNKSRLAAVTPDTGDVVGSWTTTVNNNLVRALSADSADRLYVGGSFGRIGGRVIARLGAVSQSTGAVDTGFAPKPAATVRALTLSDDGSMLYVGGPFSSINGVARPGAAEVVAATGAITSFAPAEGGVVISMDINHNGRLFFGTTSNRTYAYDPGASNQSLYRVRTGGDVQAILALDDEVYIGGHFNTLPEAKLERAALASFLPGNGQPTAWNPGANGPFGVWALALTRTPLSPEASPALSIGGDFTRVGGLARRGYTKFLFA
jgi:hypothetical protein